MPTELLRRGGLYSVYVRVDHRGHQPVREMVADAIPQEQKQFLKRVERLADRGPEGPHCSIADSRAGIWDLTASKHIRVWFLRDGPKIILLHSLRKTKRPTDPHGIERARELADEYYLERGND